MGGWNYVLILMGVIAFGPALIILFSKRVSRWKKVKWIIYSLIPLVILPVLITIALMIVFQGERNLVGLYSGMIFPLPTYASVWIVLFVFFRKNKISHENAVHI
jgi:hypothetical protein